MLFSIRNWLRARQERRALVDSDARDLIARFGDQAYYEARMRDFDELRNATVDANRPPGHWSRVKYEVARRTGHKGGKDWSGYSAE